MSHLFPGRWLAVHIGVLSQVQGIGKGRWSSTSPGSSLQSPRLREELGKNSTSNKPRGNSAGTQLWVPALISVGFSGWQ